MSKINEELSSAEEFRRSSHVLKGLRIRGEITGQEDFRVDGAVDGSIRLARGVLTIAEKGTVKGDVVVPETIVHGTLNGNLQARERVKITSKGSIIGDVTTARMMIEDGGQYRGVVDIGPENEQMAAAKT